MRARGRGPHSTYRGWLLEPGTFQPDANPLVVAKWAFLEKMMILNQVDQPGFNADVMRQLAGASQPPVHSETSGLLRPRSSQQISDGSSSRSAA